MRAGDVEEGILNCALAWVVRGESFRDLTEGEAIAARNLQARRREPLELAEIYGVVYEPPEAQTSAFQREVMLAREASRFAATESGRLLRNAKAPAMQLSAASC